MREDLRGEFRLGLSDLRDQLRGEMVRGFAAQREGTAAGLSEFALQFANELAELRRVMTSIQRPH